MADHSSDTSPQLSTPTRVRVVLASQSPRRRELLTLIGVPHDVRPADIDETVLPGEEPMAYCERLARGKAAVVAALAPDALVIGSDTIVVINDRILGKPVDRADAIRTLEQLEGRTHTVHTAVAVAWNGEMRAGIETVAVTFRPLSRAQIEAYVDTGEPMDKAGAYGIQGFGATNIERVHGDYFAVMGLPVGRMIELVRSLGLSYAFGPLTAPATA
jgi:septum formation protein